MAIGVGFISEIISIGKELASISRRAVGWILRRNITTPRDTIRIVPMPRDIFWTTGSHNKKPAMLVYGNWYVTNITRETDVRILGAYLEKPYTEGVVLQRDPEPIQVSGNPAIPPGRTMWVETIFGVQPPVREKGEDLRVTVVLRDQLGNKHRIRNIVFEGRA